MHYRLPGVNIPRRKSVREGYLEHLLALKGVTRDEADSLIARLEAEPDWTW